MLIQMQKKSFRFDKKVFLGGTLNLDISSKFWGNFKGFWGNPGKYRMLDVKSVGSKGLMLDNTGAWVVEVNPSLLCN